jgi:hypothetical protein
MAALQIVPTDSNHLQTNDMTQTPDSGSTATSKCAAENRC